MTEYYKQTEAKLVKDSSAADHRVDAVLDLNEIKLGIGTTLVGLRDTLAAQELRIFATPGGAPRPILDETVRKSTVRVVKRGEAALEELKEKFVDFSIVGGTAPPEIKMAGDSMLVENAIKEIEALLESYKEKLKDHLSPKEKEDLGLEVPRLSPENQSEEARQLRKEVKDKGIGTLIGKWYAGDISSSGEIRYVAEAILDEEIKNLRDTFIKHSLSIGEPATEGETRWENFSKLIDSVWGLIDFKIMHGSTLDTDDGINRHDRMFDADDPPPDKSTTKTSSMEVNNSFNYNEIVGAMGNLDREEMHCSTMGVIQAICFAVYQEMKMDKPLTGEPPTPGKSLYSRNQSFGSGSYMTALIDHATTMTSIPMWDTKATHSHEYPYNINEEFNKFPTEVREILKSIARMKIARDDLGSEAGSWHLLKGGSYKYKKGRGANGRPAFIFPAMRYQIGKKSKTENHLAISAFMSPENLPYMKATAGNDITQATLRMIEFVDRYEMFENPQLEGSVYHFNRSTGKYDNKHKYKPTGWRNDFPSLASFFNQPKERVYTGAIYKMARDAVLWMIQESANSPLLKINANSTIAAEQAKALVTDFTSKIGEMYAFCGPYNDGTPFYNPKAFPPGTPPGTVNPDLINPYNYVNELVMAAFKYFIQNIILAIPLDSKPTALGSAFRGMAMEDYDSRYKAVVDAIEETINLNTTIRDYFWKELTGMVEVGGVKKLGKGFVHLDFKKRWTQPEKWEKNTIKAWALENIPELKRKNWNERRKYINEPVESPAAPSKESDGWASNYREAK